MSQPEVNTISVTLGLRSHVDRQGFAAFVHWQWVVLSKGFTSPIKRSLDLYWPWDYKAIYISFDCWSFRSWNPLSLLSVLCIYADCGIFNAKILPKHCLTVSHVRLSNQYNPPNSFVLDHQPCICLQPLQGDTFRRGVLTVSFQSLMRKRRPCFWIQDDTCRQSRHRVSP